MYEQRIPQRFARRGVVRKDAYVHSSFESNHPAELCGDVGGMESLTSDTKPLMTTSPFEQFEHPKHQLSIVYGCKPPAFPLQLWSTHG